MNASLIMIGTELTRGIIQDKNGPMISRELTHLGVHVSLFEILPDDGSIERVLESEIARSGLVMITGGLGPTTDDMTRRVIADASGHPLVRDEESWKMLVAKLGERAYGPNEKQAMIPEGFTAIPNGNGTAPGFYGYAGSCLIVCLPGPPRELEPMLYDSVLPLIRKKLDLPDAERDEYSTFITAEAKLEELYEGIDPDLDWGTRFQDYRISLYVSGKTARERGEAIARLRSKLGEGRVADGDTDPLTILISALTERKATVSAAESCTGGLASSLLTERPGSSSFMLGAVTSYAASAKENVLGVPASIIEKHGTVSGECALSMAEGVRRIMGSDYSFSITGVAGPDEDENKPVGTVYIGFAGKDRKSESIMLKFISWGRASVRRRAAAAAFILLAMYIEGRSPSEIVSSWNYL